MIGVSGTLLDFMGVVVYFQIAPAVKLKTKILMGYGAVIALILLVCGWGIYNIRRLGQASDTILQENYQSIRYAEIMLDRLKRQNNAVLLFLLENRQQGRQQFIESEIQFLIALEQAKSSAKLNQEEEILNRLEKQYQDYLNASTAVTQNSATQSPISIDYYYETLLPRLNGVRDSALELRQSNQTAMLEASQQTQLTSQKAIWSMIIAGGIATGLGFAFSLILSKRLVRPLQEMILATEQIAEGNYDIQIHSTSRDELGHLVRAIALMSQKLKAFQELNIEKTIAEKQRNEAIIFSISDGLIVVDSEFKIIALNPAAAKIINVNSKVAIDNHFLDVFGDRQLYQYIQTTAQTGKSPQLDERESIFVVDRGKVRLYYKFSITPVIAPSDKIIGVVLLLQDITKLKELDRLKSDFVATASHELRTPLTSMAMSINLLLETAVEKLGDRETELLQAAAEDVERLSALANDLLDLSKIESGRIEMELMPTEVKFLLKKAISTLKIQAEDKQIQLLAKSPENFPQVQIDPNKVIWVLTNLIANAIRYTDRGGKIQVLAKARGDWVYISVEDKGDGIPWEYQQKIFDKFVQVKTDKDVGGSGLGLAICKEIVKAHGGTIWVDSAPGEGSTFTFTLPIISQWS